MFIALFIQATPNEEREKKNLALNSFKKEYIPTSMWEIMKKIRGEYVRYNT